MDINTGVGALLAEHGVRELGNDIIYSDTEPVSGKADGVIHVSPLNKAAGVFLNNTYYELTKGAYGGMKKTTKDENDVFAVVETKNLDGTLAFRSTLFEKSATTGLFGKRKLEIFEFGKLKTTRNFNLIYDTDGILTDEVLI